MFFRMNITDNAGLNPSTGWWSLFSDFFMIEGTSQIHILLPHSSPATPLNAEPTWLPYVGNFASGALVAGNAIPWCTPGNIVGAINTADFIRSWAGQWTTSLWLQLVSRLCMFFPLNKALNYMAPHAATMMARFQTPRYLTNEDSSFGFPRRVAGTSNTAAFQPTFFDSTVGDLFDIDANNSINALTTPTAMVGRTILLSVTRALVGVTRSSEMTSISTTDDSLIIADVSQQSIPYWLPHNLAYVGMMHLAGRMAAASDNWLSSELPFSTTFLNQVITANGGAFSGIMRTILSRFGTYGSNYGEWARKYAERFSGFQIPCPPSGISPFNWWIRPRLFPTLSTPTGVVVTLSRSTTTCDIWRALYANRFEVGTCQPFFPANGIHGVTGLKKDATYNVITILGVSYFLYPDDNFDLRDSAAMENQGAMSIRDFWNKRLLWYYSNNSAPSYYSTLGAAFSLLNKAFAYSNATDLTTQALNLGLVNIVPAVSAFVRSHDLVAFGNTGERLTVMKPATDIQAVYLSQKIVSYSPYDWWIYDGGFQTTALITRSGPSIGAIGRHFQPPAKNSEGSSNLAGSKKSEEGAKNQQSLKSAEGDGLSSSQNIINMV